MSRKVIPIICGPTASGKTNLALKASEDVQLEIVNADSRQVYKYFNIGTNKGKIIHRKASLLISGFEIPQVIVDGSTPGWVFDFLEPDDEFNVNDFQEIAYGVIDNILERGILPVIVGGTGLYIDSLVRNYNFSIEPDHKLRSKLEKLNILQLQELLNEKGFNLDDLNNSDRNNPVRLIRILEKIQSGKDENNNTFIKKFDYKLFYPDIEREDLYKKIDARVEELFDEGLVHEVEDLIQEGYRDARPMQGIGYKEVVDFIDGKLSLEETKERVKQSHKQYAKRQITWFEGEGRNYDLTRVSNKNITSHLQNL